METGICLLLAWFVAKDVAIALGYVDSRAAGRLTLAAPGLRKIGIIAERSSRSN